MQKGELCVITMTEDKRTVRQKVSDCIIDMYKNSKPSIDLTKYKGDKMLKPNNYIITAQKFDEILKKHNLKIDRENFFLFLNKAPKRVTEAKK
jgi:hypothetical protein